jgi:phage-related protein
MMYILVMNWQIFFYKDQHKKCPFEDFLIKRPTKDQAKIAAWLTQLQAQGPQLPRPYADLLRDGIHELRIKLRGEQVRVLYFFIHGQVVILTHAFVKNQSKVPLSEIEYALTCKTEYLKRFDSLKLLKEFHNG